MHYNRVSKNIALFLTVVLTVLPVCSICANAKISDESLTGHWSLDDGISIALGESFTENVHNADAQYWGNSTLCAPNGFKKKLGNAEGITGKSFNPGNYNYIKTDSVPTSVLDANKEMTIALWLKTPATIKSDNQYWVFGLGPENSGNAIGYNLNCDGKEGLVWRIPQWQEKGLGGGYVSGNKDGNKLTMLAADEIQTNTWYHVALKLKYGIGNSDNSVNYVSYECYLNGEKIARLCGYVNWHSPITSFFYNTDTEDNPDNYIMTIGAGVRGGKPAASNFVGCVDDVRVYSRADDINVASIYCSEKEIYVSPTGSDTSGDGTISNPFATINGAKEHLRGIRKSNVTVYLRGGIYRHSDTINFDSNDSAINGCAITYKAYPGETPVISGGIQITDWSSVGNRVYKAAVSVDAVRNLYVNNKPRDNVSSKLTQAADVIKDEDGSYIGLYVDKSIISADMNPADIRINFEQVNWTNCILKVAAIEDGDKYTKVYMDRNKSRDNQSYLDIAIKNSPIMPLNASFRAENTDWENLKSGEWYFDMEAKEIYYKLLEDEDINDLYITVPRTETLVNIDGGTSKITGIAFEGIIFEESAWNDGCYNSYKTFQAGELFYRGNEITDSMVPSGIRVNMADNITFERCTVRNFGAAGIGLCRESSNIKIQGCIIEDIAEAGINIGTCRIRHELSQKSEDLFHTENIVVSNNLIQRIGTIYYGAVGIEIYSSKNSIISNNRLREMPYTGIGVGFSTTNKGKTVQDVTVCNNLVESVCEKLYDGGGIYTLGRMDGTMICNNYITRIHNFVETEKVSAGYENYGIYLDQGTSQVTVENNVVANSWKSVSRDVSMQKILRNTYTDTSLCYDTRAAHSDDEDLTMEGAVLEPPIVLTELSSDTKAVQIINNSGISDAYQDIESSIDYTRNAAPTQSPSKTSFELSVYDTVNVDTGAVDDGVPYSTLTCRWEVVAAPDSAYNTYSGSAIRYPEAVYIKNDKCPSGSEITFSKPGNYVLKCTVSDGELSSSAEYNFTVNGLNSNFSDAAHNSYATSTSVYNNNSAHMPEVIVDGSSESFAPEYWKSFSDSQQSVTVDLGASLSIDTLTVKMRSRLEDVNANSNFVIQLSNHEDFTDFYTVGGAESLPVPIGRTISYKLENVDDYRYIRITGTKKGTIFCIDELCAYVDTSKTESLSYIKKIAIENSELKAFTVSNLKGHLAGVPIAAIYDDQSLSAVYTGEKITANENTSVTFDIDESLAVIPGETVRIFICDSLKALHPVDNYKVSDFQIK